MEVKERSRWLEELINKRVAERNHPVSTQVQYFAPRFRLSDQDRLYLSQLSADMSAGQKIGLLKAYRRQLFEIDMKLLMMHPAAIIPGMSESDHRKARNAAKRERRRLRGK